MLVEVQKGAAPLWSKVARVDGDRVFLRHDNRKSMFSHYEGIGFPLSSVRGLVLTGFTGDVKTPEFPDGK